MYPQSMPVNSCGQPEAVKQSEVYSALDRVEAALHAYENVVGAYLAQTEGVRAVVPMPSCVAPDSQSSPRPPLCEVARRLAVIEDHVTAQVAVVTDALKALQL